MPLYEHRKTLKALRNWVFSYLGTKNGSLITPWVNFKIVSSLWRFSGSRLNLSDPENNVGSYGIIVIFSLNKSIGTF